jgi:hypothetical protein
MGGNNHEAMVTITAAATMRGGCWCQCNDVTISHDKVRSMSGSSGSAGGGEAAVAPVSTDERCAANGRAFATDRRHPRTATARVVNTMATRATQKARGLRATRVRATRVIMETSPREEGDNGHNNQLDTKAAPTARTVVATTVRG